MWNYTPWLPTYGGLSLNIDVHPVTKVATVTQTANAISLFGGLAVASNVAAINQK